MEEQITKMIIDYTFEGYSIDGFIEDSMKQRRLSDQEDEEMSFIYFFEIVFNLPLPFCSYQPKLFKLLCDYF